MTGPRLLLVATLFLGVAILGVLWTQIDVSATATQLARVGLGGAVVILSDLALALLGPLLAWRILMRADGIDIGYGATIAAGLMGQAVNLVSPMMYFGGEGVRTVYVARVASAPYSRVLATVLAAEFQQFTALVASIVVSLVIVSVSHRPHDIPMGWMIGDTLVLASLVGVMLSALLLDLRLLTRLVGLLVRAGFLSVRLTALKEAVGDMEDVVRGLLVRRRRAFLVAQLIMLVSPVAQFALPALFFWLLRRVGATVPTPSVAELASCFVLVQFLFMLPTTPAGLGVYEGGIVGIFRLHGWSVPDGAAYAVLIRLDDVLFSLAGVALAVSGGVGRGFGRARTAPSLAMVPGVTPGEETTSHHV